MLLDLLLPPTCAACDAEVSAPGQLCGACFGGLSFIGEPLCRFCGLPFIAPGQACLSCQEERPPWGQARAALLYNTASKALVLPLKHADRTEIAHALALHMHRAGAALLAGADWLVPVPLHRWRLLRRRYNQAALLAGALGKRAGVRSLPDALARSRATPPLGRFTAAQRSAWMMENIVVRPHRRAAVAGRHIVLVDDVLTSGATARACARALLEAGAANVDVLVACRVADPRREPVSGDDVDDD